MSYEIETPSPDPRTSARPTDFQIEEPDAPPRRRDARTEESRLKRKPFVALTDVSPRLLFPRTYFDSDAPADRDRRADPQPEPEVRQATWRPLDAEPTAGAPKAARRGLVRRTWERFARRFGPPPPIVR